MAAGNSRYLSDNSPIFVAQTLTLKLARIYPVAGKDRARCVNYRHLVHSLSAKLQAFRFLQFREELLPGGCYQRLNFDPFLTKNIVFN